ncbi:hypothetical protein E2C01_057478 [Portunus trituberculatus]|uniref:Uncharacterized protein n=1 Tax=Portunus trituberculatus TaxID=210409 RepID=A0A5B7GTL2_PORTR|nr:hypothetical protein [Portunus trituberculatus]
MKLGTFMAQDRALDFIAPKGSSRRCGADEFQNMVLGREAGITTTTTTTTTISIASSSESPAATCSAVTSLSPAFFIVPASYS